MPQPLPQDILSVSVRDFLAATAAKSPTPGGGAVAAVCGAAAAALAEMALQYTVGKKQFAAHQVELTGSIAQLRKASSLMQDLVAEDIAAYAALSEVLKLPADQRSSDPRYLPAVAAAIVAPQSVGALALHILELCHALLAKCNPFLLSDLAIAACYARAAVEASEFNVLVNLRLLRSSDEAASYRKKMREMTKKADNLWQAVRVHVTQALSS